MRPAKTIVGRVAGLHVGESGREDLSKAPRSSVSVELDGIVDDNHRGFSREAYDGDKEPEGTVRRNERQWSGMAMEEIAVIARAMDLDRDLEGADLHRLEQDVEAGVASHRATPKRIEGTSCGTRRRQTE